jgi:predicted RNA-binding protein YlqC (UPF0109 family)
VTALIAYLVRAMATQPDEVVVEEEDRGDHIVIHVQCAEEDKGRIIGREGRVANAMRSLLHVASTRAGVRASLNIE